MLTPGDFYYQSLLPSYQSLWPMYNNTGLSSNAEQLNASNAEQLNASNAEQLNASNVEELNSFKRSALTTLVRCCALGVLGVLGVSAIALARNTLSFDQRGLALSENCVKNGGVLFTGKEPKFWACIEEKNPEKSLLVTRVTDYTWPDWPAWHQLTGNGVIEKASSVYEGPFVRGMPEGKGKVTNFFTSGNLTFVGNFRNGEIQNEGTWARPDISYTGGFSNKERFLKNGTVFLNGRSYEVVDGKTSKVT